MNILLLLLLTQRLFRAVILSILVIYGLLCSLEGRPRRPCDLCPESCLRARWPNTSRKRAQSWNEFVRKSLALLLAIFPKHHVPCRYFERLDCRHTICFCDHFRGLGGSNKGCRGVEKYFDLSFFPTTIECLPRRKAKRST